jgi:hypothetical protein
MSVSVPYNDIVRMLEECAPGADIRRTTHARRVAWNGKLFPDLPKFDDIQIGHIRKMVRHLGIKKECAEKHKCY